MLRRLSSLCVQSAFCLCLFCCGHKGVKEIKPAESLKQYPSIIELNKNSASYVDSFITISGKLLNVGKDYFKDLQIVLKDSLGNAIRIRPWLPVEIPPPQNPSLPRPKVMSDYLNKDVVLKGFWRQENANECRLEVKKATIFDNQ